MQTLIAKAPLRQAQVELRRAGVLGLGEEGTVLEVTATVRRDNRFRTLPLVEKAFHLPLLLAGHPYQNPGLQFETISLLARLNRERKLGLSLVPTVRLVDDGKLPALLMTRLNGVASRESLGPEELAQFTDDILRQKRILEQNGFEADGDAFFPVLRNGWVAAVIGDFGTISQKKE